MSREGSTQQAPSIVALDIGGANLKTSDGAKFARSVRFPMWKRCRELPAVLTKLLAEAPDADIVAITMTAELADCFASRQEGVHYVLNSVCAAAKGRKILVYLTNGRLVDPHEARSQPLLAAASNWHILAVHAANQIAPQQGCLIDIGSTTCDIIPLGGGQVLATGTDDFSRMKSSELVYTGIGRTPVCSILPSASLHGQTVPLAKEFFATAQDAYVLLGELAENPDDTDTADGRPVTRAAARARLARMFCLDTDTFSVEDATDFAQQIARHQCDEILAAAKIALSSANVQPESFVVSGSGEFLAKQIAWNLGGDDSHLISFTKMYDAHISRCATAYTLAKFAASQTHGLKRFSL